MNLGNNLKALRKERNITQEDLASYLSVSPQTVSKWENNASAPDISMLPILADFYDTTIDGLLQYSSTAQKNKMKELSKYVHGLLADGQNEAAYNWLKKEMPEWALSASVNHLFSVVIRAYALEQSGEVREKLLLEAISQCDKVMNLDQNETDKSTQAKMTKCFCLFDLGRFAEAEKVAKTLPSVYSSRERIMCKITSGEKHAENVQYARKVLAELMEEL